MNPSLAADEFTLVSRREVGDTHAYLFDSKYGKFEFQVNPSRTNVIHRGQPEFLGTIQLGGYLGEFRVNGSRPWYGHMSALWVESRYQNDLTTTRPYVEPASFNSSPRRVSLGAWTEAIYPLIAKAVESTLGDRPDPEELVLTNRYTAAKRQYDRRKPQFEEAQAELLVVTDELAKLRGGKRAHAVPAEA